MNPRALACLMVLAAALTCAGCGRQVSLKPKLGMQPVPTPASATQPETPDALIRPSTQSRPLRNVDILSRSQERKDDPFDLPPGPDNGKR